MTLIDSGAALGVGQRAERDPRLPVTRAEVAFLAAAASATAALHLTMFGQPMLNSDESSLQIMGLTVFSEPGGTWYEYSMNFGSRLGQFPVQFAPYIGALGAYASLPFTYALGPTVEAVRAYNMAVAISIQLAVYLVARQLFSRSSAVIATGALGAFPFFVFYSRQGSMYDWAVLPVLLLSVWFGVRFARGGSAWFLAAAALSAGLAVWGYLYALWPVLGVLAALPLALRRADLRRAALCCAVLGLAGLALLGAQHAASSGGSLASFLLDTAREDTSYLRPGTDNAAVLPNLSVRAGHLHDLLTRPVMGLYGANMHYLAWNPHDPTFAVLLGAGASVGAAAVIRRTDWRGFVVMLAVVGATVAASTVTVTVLNPVQLGVAVPFAFVLMGGGLGRASAWLANTAKLKKAGLRQWHLVVVTVAVVAASQAPHLHAGFSAMHDEPGSGYRQAAAQLGAYLKETESSPAAMDWWTFKSLFIVLGGAHAPSDLYGPWENKEFDDEARALLRSAPSPVPVGKDTAFVLYMYPEELDCSSDLSSSDIPRSNQCAQTYFVESLAGSAGLEVESADFDLSDGTPYYRVLRMVDPGQP